MAKKFLTGIRLLNLIEDPATGVEGEVYFNTTTFATRIYADGGWKYLSESAEELLIQIKNTTGSTINKGTPVYITGSVGGSTVLTVGLADASSASAMPAVGLVRSNLLNDTEGFAQVGGFFRQFTTSPIDGQTPSPNSTVYVKAGGGLTLTKPTGTNLIQNIAKVARVHESAGSLIVSSIMRTNDIPNIPQNKFWLGNSSGVPTAVDFSTEVNRSASATYATQVYAVNAASSASANVNVLALSYASSASANADVRALSYANNTTLGIVSSSVVFEITKPDLTIGDIPEGFIWLDSDDSVTSITSAGVVTLTASEPSSPTHGMVWVDRDASVNSVIVDGSSLNDYLTKTRPLVTSGTTVDLRSASVMFTTASVSGISTNTDNVERLFLALS